MQLFISVKRERRLFSRQQWLPKIALKSLKMWNKGYEDKSVEYSIILYRIILYNCMQIIDPPGNKQTCIPIMNAFEK